eukprot:scaffold80917_cov63-Phaeocystis_antarctica.AAC.1
MVPPLYAPLGYQHPGHVDIEAALIRAYRELAAAASVAENHLHHAIVGCARGELCRRLPLCSASVLIDELRARVELAVRVPAHLDLHTRPGDTAQLRHPRRLRRRCHPRCRRRRLRRRPCCHSRRRRR